MYVSTSVLKPTKQLTHQWEKKILRYAAEMILKKDVLYKLVDDNCVLVIKREQVANILKECHDDIGGHKGIHGTYAGA